MAADTSYLLHSSRIEIPDMKVATATREEYTSAGGVNGGGV